VYSVELYAAVRRAVLVEGVSERQAARRFGISRKSVRKMLRFAVPPGYARSQPTHRPKLGPFVELIEQILAEDQKQPRKQRHTARRLFDRLKGEYGYDGGYTVVADYVRTYRQQQQEMFVPLQHAPGEAQVDFGEADVILAGVVQRAHYFVMDLPHSDDAFVMAFPAETTEAFCEGHNQAFAYFGGVPPSIVYDNTSLAVVAILAEGQRQKTKVFCELESHYLFTPRFARPAKGNDKGNVEGLVGYARRNFLVPVPRAANWEELNELLRQRCQERRSRRVRSETETIGERSVRDQQAFLPLPAAPYEACETVATRVSSLSLVRYRTNDYSVPVAYGHRPVLVKGYVHEVVISWGADVIARHLRSYQREDTVYDPLHYLPLLERKANALDQAAPLAGWALPEEFALLRRLLEARQGKPGKREYIQILRLLETFSLELVHSAVAEALRLQAVSLDAVRHLLLCRIEHRPPRLDLTQYPHLPTAQVALTQATDYLALLGEGGY
jgi:transposase